MDSLFIFSSHHSCIQFLPFKITSEPILVCVWAYVGAIGKGNNWPLQLYARGTAEMATEELWVQFSAPHLSSQPSVTLVTGIWHPLLTFAGARHAHSANTYIFRFFFFFKTKFLGCFGTLSVDQAASASWMLGLKVCATTAWLKHVFFK